MEKKTKKLSRIITIRLFIAVFIAFVVSSAVTYTVLYISCAEKANALLQYGSVSLSIDIKADTNTELFNSFGGIIETTYAQEGEEAAAALLEGTNYSYVAKMDGTIYLSGNADFIGKNVKDIEYISSMIDFALIYMEQNSSPISYEMTPTTVKTLDGKLDVYYLLTVSRDIPDSVILSAHFPEGCADAAVYASEMVSMNRNVGLTGFNIVINSDYDILTTATILPNTYHTKFPYPEILDRYNEGTDEKLKTFDLPIYFDGEIINVPAKMLFDRAVLWDTDYFYCVNQTYGTYILSLYPAEEALEQANNTIFIIVLIEVVVFTVLFIVLRLLIKRRVIRKLNSVNASLSAITAGNLDEKVEVRDSREFDALSTDINATVDKLKDYIAEAAARIDADLAVAKAIQSSALPNVFPPFPERKEFELFASMNAAKEVGGDFYDFYMLNDHTLGFLIADVSGKSIPGAMFMMTSKTVIKSLAESGLPPAEVFSIANEKLCEGNEAEMFVTAWLGYLDLKTGLVRIANAGHNPPVLIHGGKAEYVILKPGLMLAGMDGVRYKEQTLQLEKGDILYLYTDGVTEAMDKDEEQYGEDRLQKLLSFGENYPAPSAANGIAETVCDMVTADVTKFTNGAEQSDDITMLCVRFLGGE